MRVPAVVTGLSLALAGALPAQARPEVTVSLRSGDEPGAVVQMRALLDDRRFLRALESGFPLYVEYRLELRQSRSLWDRTVRDYTIQYVVAWDPVRETFAVEDPNGAVEYESVSALQRRLDQVYVFPGRLPDEPGTYYYKAIVEARMLTDEDVDEVYAWLHGANRDAARDRPGFLTRAARRLLQRVVPLPRERYEARTPDIPRD